MENKRLLRSAWRALSHVDPRGYEVVLRPDNLFAVSMFPEIDSDPELSPLGRKWIIPRGYREYLMSDEPVWLDPFSPWTPPENHGVKYKRRELEVGKGNERPFLDLMNM